MKTKRKSLSRRPNCHGYIVLVLDKRRGVLARPFFKTKLFPNAPDAIFAMDKATRIYEQLLRQRGQKLFVKRISVEPILGRQGRVYIHVVS